MATTKPKAETKVILHNVRLAFPDVFKAVQFEGAGKFSYRATFLIPAGSPDHATVNAAIGKAAAAKWPGKHQEVLKTLIGQSQKYCFIDGNLKEYDGYAGNWALSASRSQESGAPLVIDQRRQPLTVEDGKPYGGCYVNAKVQIWAQDNQWGKGMRATLETVQFVKDGDAFGGAGPATDDGFEEIEDLSGDLL